VPVHLGGEQLARLDEEHDDQRPGGESDGTDAEQAAGEADEVEAPGRSA
jgi:hypothetical protein